MSKWLYHFKQNSAEGNANMTEILGGKGAGLAEMSNLGLAIPAGFTITTAICEYYYQHNNTMPANFNDELAKAIKQLEINSGKIFGDNKNPLLLAVRSGARASMPGMMDTILNLGMNDEVVIALANITNNQNFAYDSYRRFLEVYSRVVLNIPQALFTDVVASKSIKDNKVESLKAIIRDYKQIIKKYTNSELPTDPYEQLTTAITAVLKSWMSYRAMTYRRLNNIPAHLGTAVNVQSMVFGNLGENSATGVVFTRCPATGNKKIFGEFLINAQGEDVVSGIRTPEPITALSIGRGNSMQEVMPDLYQELATICVKLELYFKDMQDIEFTIENSKLYILQTRNAKRSAASAIKVAVDMVGEQILTKEQALMSIAPESLNQLLHARIDYSKKLPILAQGLPASPGGATGIVVFSPYDAEEMSHHHKVILVRNDISPEDIQGMHVATGILTARGGMTAHAAVVARGMGKPCVCGVSAMIVDEDNKRFKVGDIIVNHGEEITIDGTSGNIFLGKVPLMQPNFSLEFATLLSWADDIRDLSVRANAETDVDSTNALKFGAEGIGLCRTEHMFFDSEKISLVREMIIAPDINLRTKAIDKLLPLQVQDFKKLFRILQGKPINIRLLDPPLHEFLPKSLIDKEALADKLNISMTTINNRLNALHEVNPMLGHRGCRLGISYPEMYKMQISAILTAMHDLNTQEGIKTNLELMIPLVVNVNELKKIKQDILTICDKDLKLTIGTMIELPRAALLSEDIAKEVEFFSFGTNDLTQTTYGISRDDIASFLPDYINKQVFEYDPFVKLDEAGVGELIKMSITRGKSGNPNLKVGVCGEHAGNPESIDFFHNIGLDYISCSPYRIPIARLAAAQSKIRHG